MSQSKKKSRSSPKAVQSKVGSMLRPSLGEDHLAAQEGNIHAPQADVYETENEIVILVDLPGIPKGNVYLFVTSDRIIIEAKKKEKKSSKNARYHCIERYFGKFHRSIEIPSTVHTGKIDASMQNGVLVIRLPKIPDRRGMRKRIEIK